MARKANETKATATRKPAAKRTRKTVKKVPAKTSSVKTDLKFWKLVYDRNSVSDEKLDKVAIIDNGNKYTFRQLFRRSEEYAEVFSGLGISAKNHSRIGMIMSASAASVFVLYGANMIGVSVSALYEQELINTDRFIESVKKEKITDFIVDPQYVNPKMMKDMMDRKDECGLKNVIVIPMDYKITKYFNVMAKQMHDANYRAMKELPGVLDMKDLLVKYEAAPIQKSEKLDDAAYIVHTSGTTKGIHKPIPLSDQAVNETVRRVLDDPTFDKLQGGTILFWGMLSSAYQSLFQINMPLAAGCTVVFVPLGYMNPNAAQALMEFKVSIIVTVDWFYDMILMPNRYNKQLDLSNVDYVVLGGEFCSAQRRKDWNTLIAEKGGHAKLAVGYGLSEAGGAVILSKPGVEDDSIGYPMVGVKVKIQDENDDQFYDISDGQRSGGLYISSASNSTGRLDGTQFFETETIDGEEYICTFDRVTVNENGSLTCHGRMNRYFINNDGIKFDAGLVQVSLNGEEDIEECAVVPGYDKNLHDTIPLLYVRTKTSGNAARMTVEKALYNVFVRNNQAEKTNIPNKCVICKELPHNQMGKVDIYQIINEGLDGDTYAIVAVRDNGVLKDVKVMPEAAAMLNPGTLPEEMEEEFRKFTLPFLKEMENFNMNKDGGQKPDFKKLLPLMGCNPKKDDREEPQKPYDALRQSFMKPLMGCNPRKADIEEDDEPSPRYNPTLLPLMGCNPRRKR